MSTPDADPRPVRATCVSALLAGGLSSLAWAPQASASSRRSRRRFSQLAGNLLPVGGWRIYTISGSMPIFDPKAYRLEITGLVRKPRSFDYAELLALPHVAPGLDLPLRDRLDGRGVRWSGVRFAHLLDLVEPLPRGEGDALRLARGALRRLAHGRRRRGSPT